MTAIPKLIPTGSREPGEAPALEGDDVDSRARFLDAALPVTPYLGVEFAGPVRFIVNTRDPIAKRLFVKRSQSNIRLLRKAALALRQIDDIDLAATSFVDISAGIGLQAIAAIRQLDFGSAVALEGSPERYRLLKINALLNEVEDRIVAIHSLVAAEPSLTGLDVRKVGRERVVSLEERPPKEGKVVAVETTTLADLISDGRIDPATVGLVSVGNFDPEGSPLEAAAPLLERSVPLLMRLRTESLEDPRTLERLQEMLGNHYPRIVDLDTVKRAPIAHPADMLGTLAERVRSARDASDPVVMLLGPPAG